MFDVILAPLEDWFVLLLWFKRKRERRREWTGTVETKKARAVSKHAYLVVFRTDDGKRKRLRLDQKEEFNSYIEGRRYTKKAGQDYPDTQPVP